MDAAQIITELAKKLHMPALANYSAYIEPSVEIEQALVILLQAEADGKDQRTYARKLRSAGFPLIKTLDTFVVHHLSTTLQAQLLDLGTSKFVQERRNVICWGNPGTGKTHVAIALGIAALRRGYTVRFVRASDLVIQMLEAHQAKRLTEYLQPIVKCNLLILDEVGYVPFDRAGANLLFDIVAKRNEIGSTLVTTNLPFSKWVEFLGDPMLTAAFVDRMVHYSVLLNMSGPSYRYKSAKEHLSGDPSPS